MEMEEAPPLILIREDEAEAAQNPSADELAEAVQLQELLFFQLQPPPPPPPPPHHPQPINDGLASPVPINQGLETSPQGSGTPNMDSHCNTPTLPPIEDPTDPKGKRSAEIQFFYSTTHPGESSRVIHDTFDCPICMDSIPTEKGFNINTCDHVFCISCMIHYITVKNEENVVVIPCPMPGCETTSVDPETCHRILPSETFDRWSLALCELSLGLKKFYCPFKDCSALLIDEGGENITNCECPHCHRMFCAKCNVSWHGDMSCEEYQSLGEDERGREDIMFRNLATDKRWPRCPKCKMFVEKIDGCMFMKCRCGYCFCYACASPMSGTTHYCAKCKR